MIVTCNQGLEVLAGVLCLSGIWLAIGFALGTMELARRRRGRR